MPFVADAIKRGLIRLDRLPRALERYGIITYQDRIRLRQHLYRQRVLLNQEGQGRIGALLERNGPLMIARLGSVELACLRCYLKRCSSEKAPYSDTIRHVMSNNAGFFPVNDAALDRFAKLYLELLPDVDLMGIWFNPYEEVICNDWCPNTELVDFECLEPFRFTAPWSSKLTGKKVLVIHPFIDSIRMQYEQKRRMLFANPAVLPEFELITLRAVQSIAGSRVDFPSWFDAYQHMCDEIARIDFDICLIGAGAYGLPLAAFVKRQGVQAIHLGGVTQILFGIKGRRWETSYADSTAKLFNEHWVRPMPSETPSNKDNVEKGCYW